MTIAPPPEDLSEADAKLVDDVLARILDLDEQIASLEEQRKSLRGLLVNLLPAGKHQRPTGTVSIRKSYRFDPKVAAKVLDADTLADISRPVPNASLARRILTEEKFRECCGAQQTAVTLS